MQEEEVALAWDWRGLGWWDLGILAAASALAWGESELIEGEGRWGDSRLFRTLERSGSRGEG